MTYSNGSMPAEAARGPAAIEVGDLWALKFGAWSVEINAERGARICSFSLNGHNILTGPSVDPDNFGSTFWTSPQSDWGWPPVPEIDNKPYAVVESDVGLVCCGSPSSKLGVLVTKRFTVVPARQCLRVEYEISNQSAETLRLSPWEVSRVRGGLSFFPTGEARYPAKTHGELEVVDECGVTWFEYDRAKIDKDQKLFAHAGNGWIAHCEDRIALIKVFDPVPIDKQAPGEATVELFASGSKDYIELEQQGPYSKIGPWKSTSWCVHWLIREIPPEISVGVGEPALAAWVQSQI